LNNLRFHILNFYLRSRICVSKLFPSVQVYLYSEYFLDLTRLANKEIREFLYLQVIDWNVGGKLYECFTITTIFRLDSKSTKLYRHCYDCL